MTVLWPNGSTNIPRVTSEFGMRTHPVTGAPSTMHYGIDLIGWSIIKAPAAGQVIFAGYNGGAGNEVRIRANNGDVYRLLHNRELWVKTGQWVAQGQDVAVMGTTGTSTGVHCHFETKPGGGAAVNPRGYMASANSGPAGGKDDDMNSEQDARLRNIEALLAGTGPSLQNPNWRGGHGSVLYHLQNIAGFIYAGGSSASDPNYLGAEGTLYRLAKAPVRRTDGQGKPYNVSQIQDNADTNTFARQILALVQQIAARPVVEFTDEQTEVIADGLAKALADKGLGGATPEQVREALSDVLGSLVLRPDTAGA